MLLTNATMEEENPFVTYPPKRANAESIPGCVPDEEQLYESSEESESSIESPVEVNEAVRDDMCRLEEVFVDMGLKFRMIDRIGEGKRAFS